MTVERSKRRCFLTLTLIVKSVSEILLIHIYFKLKKKKIKAIAWIQRKKTTIALCENFPKLEHSSPHGGTVISWQNVFSLNPEALTRKPITNQRNTHERQPYFILANHF